MSKVVIAVFKAADAPLSRKWNPGLVLRLFKSVVNYVKACIISLSILLFVSIVGVALQSYAYMT